MYLVLTVLRRTLSFGEFHFNMFTRHESVSGTEPVLCGLSSVIDREKTNDDNYLAD